MAGMERYSDDYYDSLYRNIPENSYIKQNENIYEPASSLATHSRFRSEQPDSETTLKKFIGNGVSIASLIAENLLSHPFVVLRRQCQVHNNSHKLHIIPVTLMPVIYNLHKHQGITTLWKGLGSALMVRGMTLGVEDLISKFTPLPKEIFWHSSLKSFFQHIFLKGITFTIVMPFYCASLVETVQSDIAAEKPGMFDVFQAGAMRLFDWRGNAKGRMLPVWNLVLPTITLGIARYFCSLIVNGCAFRIMQAHNKHKLSATGTLPKSSSNSSLLQEMELNSSLIAVIATDMLFYPFETILHRLYLQGTRTIIDNLDAGKAVLPILTNYYGPIDCYETCLQNEGIFGFYKGFGALILQHVAHVLVIHITRTVFTKFSSVFYHSNQSSNKPTAALLQNVVKSQGYLSP